METFLQKLIASTGASEGQFKPVARYYANMDFLLYVNEDCSYSAERVNPFLTVLWHPQEERLVGIRLKGFKFLFERIRAIVDFKDGDFLPLTKAFEVSLTAGMAETIMNKHTERTNLLYEKAREFVREVDVPLQELRKAA